MSKKKKKRVHANALTQKNRFAMISITAVVCMLFGVLLYGSYNLGQRLSEYKQENENLQESYQDQMDYQEEIENMKDYMQTDEYKMSVAQKNLGLLNDNEIIFKPEK